MIKIPAQNMGGPSCSSTSLYVNLNPDLPALMEDNHQMIKGQRQNKTENTFLLQLGHDREGVYLNHRGTDQFLPVHRGLNF